MRKMEYDRIKFFERELSKVITKEEKIHNKMFSVNYKSTLNSKKYLSKIL
jgi:hypothetical protein